jgi:hypothetical protein
MDYLRAAPSGFALGAARRAKTSGHKRTSKSRRSFPCRAVAQRAKQNGRRARCRVAGRDIDNEGRALRAPPAASVAYFK